MRAIRRWSIKCEDGKRRDLVLHRDEDCDGTRYVWSCDGEGCEVSGKTVVDAECAALGAWGHSRWELRTGRVKL